VKLESDTLYRQWRNLTAACPDRCDPHWIDLSLTFITDSKLLAKVQRAQSEPSGYAEFGYAWFIADMVALQEQDKYAIIPRIGASSLTLKYQTPRDAQGEPYYFDYFIVPKLSRLSAAYVCADENFSPVKRSGRFVPSNYARSAVDFDVERAARRISEEGDDFYQLNRDYETKLPLPDESPRRRRKNQAENEWVDLNLIARYQFNKGSVQLLYMPVSPPVARPGVSDLSNCWQDTTARPFTRRTSIARGKRIKKIRESEGERTYSDPLMITASVLMGGGLDLSVLEKFTTVEMPDEEFTDMMTSRQVVDDAKLEELKETEIEDDDLDELFNPYHTFVFSKHFEERLRDSDPSHPNRAQDPNRATLFVPGQNMNFAKEWLVIIYDPIAEEFLPKTLSEWRTECRIDRVPLLPLDKIPALLLRGLTPDQILALSAAIGDDAPEEQIEVAVDKFISEELEARLR
jgi:hypothetical protein